jgi:hypothetical protein
MMRGGKMNNKTRIFILGLVALILVALAGCSPGMPRGTEQDAGEVSMCDLTEDLIGWRVTTAGEITFIDLSPRDGVYFEFRAGGCEAGGFIHNEFWNTFSDKEQAQIDLGSQVTVEGILTKDNYRMLVSVQRLVE